MLRAEFVDLDEVPRGNPRPTELILEPRLPFTVFFQQPLALGKPLADVDDVGDGPLPKRADFVRMLRERGGGGGGVCRHDDTLPGRMPPSSGSFGRKMFSGGLARFRLAQPANVSSIVAGIAVRLRRTGRSGSTTVSLGVYPRPKCGAPSD